METGGGRRGSRASAVWKGRSRLAGRSRQPLRGEADGRPSAAANRDRRPAPGTASPRTAETGTRSSIPPPPSRPAQKHRPRHRLPSTACPETPPRHRLPSTACPGGGGGERPSRHGRSAPPVCEGVMLCGAPMRERSHAPPGWTIPPKLHRQPGSGIVPPRES
ncbi:unnamed protein product [Coccothraustes coccothraustes]